MWLRGINLNLSASIGFIALFGVAVLNGIVLVSAINRLRDEGAPCDRAVLEGSSVRLRPVLMTTGATVMGHFPLVVVSGAGAEARNSIGIILVAGMLIGTAFTLFILPSVYMWLAGTHAALPDADPDKGSDPLGSDPIPTLSA